MQGLEAASRDLGTSGSDLFMVLPHTVIDHGRELLRAISQAKKRVRRALQRRYYYNVYGNKE
ncbi:hypothetical protein D6783_03555 [Candidatus Woesearchaeota archaeon]|nr:MAG: hypothetical protein D6783_03555 [Candidatus Woesearchaeota archaeon]